MAYDEDFARRVREQLADEDAISEKAMFGGLAFLLHGNMAVGISSGAGFLMASARSRRPRRRAGSARRRTGR